MIDIQSLMAQMNAGQPPLTGRAPPPQMLPTMSNHMVSPGLLGTYGQQAQQLAGGAPPGPYGQQASQLAGLLGGGQQFPVMGSPYQPGMFMPGFRAGIDQPIRGGGGRPRGRVQQY